MKTKLQHIAVMAAGILAVTTSVETAAQAAPSADLFSPDAKAMTKAEDAIARRYGKNDAKAQAPYRQTIHAAFEAYLDDKSLEVPFDSSSEKELSDSVSRLEKRISELDKDMKKVSTDLRKARSAYEAALDRSSSAAADTVDALQEEIDRETLLLTAELQADSLLTAEIETMRGDIEAMKRSSEELAASHIELADELDRSKDVKKEIDGRKAEATAVWRQIERNLEEMNAASIFDLSEADVKKSRDLLEANLPLIRNYSPELIDSCETVIAAQEKLLAHSRTVKEVVDFMAGKYDATKTAKYAETLRHLRPELEHRHSNEVKDVVNALELQGDNVSRMKATLLTFKNDAARFGYVNGSDEQRADFRREMEKTHVNSEFYKSVIAVRDDFVKRVIDRKDTFDYDMDKFAAYIDSLISKL